MSTTYHSVHWNRQKKLYDSILVFGIVVSIGAFVAVSLATNPNITAETLVIRGMSIAAFTLLHIILCIGPLARLDARFLPLLYNRRHIGVTMFLLALVHAGLSIVQFHALGDTNPIVSVLTAYQQDYNPVRGISNFPFEPFGLFALLILFVMAATSHDFWLRNLGASFWKALHIFVYVAYGALVVHVAYGFIQSDRSVIYPLLLATGMTTVLGLHLAAFIKERSLERAKSSSMQDGFECIGSVNDFVEGRGHVAILADRRIAIYRVEGRVFALSNACRHQAGPIGEGCLVDGLVTCPWHGWNYRMEDGVSPPPFEKECIPTHPVRIQNNEVYVHVEAYPLRTESTGAPISGGESTLSADSPDVGDA